MFNYNHLYYFYVTSKVDGISKAAAVLRISQPSLSAQLKTLEKSIDQQLFQKKGRRSVLTPAGEEVFGFCRQIFEPAENLDDFLKFKNKKRQTRISIGVSDQIERPFVTDLLSKFIRKSLGGDQPTIKMITGNHDALVDALASRQIDLLLSNRPALGEDFKVITTVDFPVGLIGSHKLFSSENLSAPIPALLKSSESGLVLPSPGHKLRQEIDAYLQKNRIIAPVFFESDILSAVVRAVHDGMGVGFVPLAYVANELKQEKVKLLGPKHSYWKHGLALMGRKGIEKLAACHELHVALEDLVESLDRMVGTNQ